jgi:hypothetical protein
LPPAQHRFPFHLAKARIARALRHRGHRQHQIAWPVDPESLAAPETVRRRCYASTPAPAARYPASTRPPPTGKTATQRRGAGKRTTAGRGLLAGWDVPARRRVWPALWAAGGREGLSPRRVPQPPPPPPPPPPMAPPQTPPSPLPPAPPAPPVPPCDQAPSPPPTQAYAIRARAAGGRRPQRRGVRCGGRCRCPAPAGRARRGPFPWIYRSGPALSRLRESSSLQGRSRAWRGASFGRRVSGTRTAHGPTARSRSTGGAACPPPRASCPQRCPQPSVCASPPSPCASPRGKAERTQSGRSFRRHAGLHQRQMRQPRRRRPLPPSTLSQAPPPTPR